MMKKKKIKSAIPIYGAAAVWLLMGLICPRLLLKMGGLALAAALSLLAYFCLSRVFKGRTAEVRMSAHSGDKSVDSLIEEGRDRLDSLKAAGAALRDEKLVRPIERMVNAGEGVLNALEKDVSQAQAVRRFMNYYLPTADKLTASYRMMLETEGAGENIDRAMRSIENSLGMIADAFEKQLDNLFKNHTLDIETDIEVLETMMAADGLLDADKNRTNPFANSISDQQEVMNHVR